MIPHQSFITSPDDAGFQQSLSRCRRQGSDWHMCRDTFGGHTKVIVITMVFRERPRHGGVAASNWATRRHSQRIKQASPNPSITYLRSRISCCLSLNNVVCDLIIASCLLSHTGKWHVCCNDSPQSSFAMCPWPVVDSGPLGPAASSMSPTRFTVLGVKVSASPRRVHRWRTSACPRSSLGCLLPSLPSQSQPCCPPHSHNHAPFPVTVTTMLPCSTITATPRPSSRRPLTPHPSRLTPHASALSFHPSPLSPHHSHPHPHTLTPSPLTPPHPHTHTPSHPHTLTPIPLTPRSSPIAPSQGCSGLTLAFAWLLLQMAV